MGLANAIRMAATSAVHHDRGRYRMAWDLLFTSDIGLLSLFTIAFILVMGAYIGVYAARHIKEDRRDHPPGTPSAMH